MFDFDIILNPKSNNNKLILNLPVHYYILFITISVLILGTIIYYGLSLSSSIFLLITVIAATFREEWEFNNLTNSMFFKIGVGFIYKKHMFNFEDVDLIERFSFIKGKNNTTEETKTSFFQKKYYSIKFHFNNGKSITMLTVNESKKVKLDKIYDSLKTLFPNKIEG